ncbi:hypothetical protein DMENIID0001_124120 [Sergentomyia squamirostris]
MATTAKQSSSTVRSPSAAATTQGEGQEDIATIAKQISDHAEAIYQTWKARGLAPSEILNCHTGSDAFGKTLTPSSSSSSQRIGRDSQSPVAELLAQAPDMSNNNLEKLVNSFVSEDKARIAAARKSSSPSPIAGIGSIKHTLQKFESHTSGSNSVIKPKFTRTSSPQPSGGGGGVNALNKNVPDVLIDTIEQNLTKREREPSPQKPQTPAKPANLINHVPSWPLKNRVVVNKSVNSGSVNRVEDETPASTAVALVRKQQEKQQEKQNHQEKQEAKKKTADLMDEVTREEERLINALKTGTVLNNEKSLPEVITSTLNQDVPDGSVNSTGELPQWNNTDLSGHPPIDASHAKVWNNAPPGAAKPVIPHLNNNNNNVIGSKDKEDTPAPAKVFKPRTLRTAGEAVLPHNLADLTNPLKVAKDKTANPIRPFLTRGSVAERVLIFEKCPQIKAPPRNAAKEPSKLQVSPLVNLFSPNLSFAPTIS